MELEGLLSQVRGEMYLPPTAVGTRLRRHWIVRSVRPLPDQQRLLDLQRRVEGVIFEVITEAYTTAATPEQLAAVRPALLLVRLDDLHLIVRTEYAGYETSIGNVAAIAQIGALQKIDQEIEFDELQGLPAVAWFWLRRVAPQAGSEEPG